MFQEPPHRKKKKKKIREKLAAPHPQCCIFNVFLFFAEIL
jgi:hypothetical protein